MEAGVFGPGLCSPDSSRGKCPRPAFTHKKLWQQPMVRLPPLPSRSRADEYRDYALRCMIDGERKLRPGPARNNWSWRARPTDMRRTPIYLLILLALASCTPAAEGQGSRSGVAGKVLIGPQCPVEQAGSPCPDKPVAAEVQIFSAGSDELVTSSDSGENGRFRIDLEPGSYELLPVVSESGGLPYGTRTHVTVEAGEYHRVTLSLDSGIR